eukprot:SAG25_NODE_12960_length_273_cov_0.597701_1_plen_32_part_10
MTDTMPSTTAPVVNDKTEALAAAKNNTDTSGH